VEDFQGHSRGDAEARSVSGDGTRAVPAPSDAPPAPNTLDALRERIDEVDRAIVALLNERAALASAIGDLKRAANAPIYAPHREAQVLARVLALNEGPLPPKAVEGIYREIMSASFSLERGLVVAFLGPAGSFSHLAALRHFGANATLEPVESIEGVFTSVSREHAEVGLTPIENSIHGSVAETLDAFTAFAGRVHIQAEAQVDVRQVFAAACPPDRVTRVYSKPEALNQCRRWLGENYPRAELIGAPSTSRAMQMVAEEARANPAGACSAAIGGALGASLHGLSVLFEGIEDRAHNITRFFVLARRAAQRTGDDKTSVMFQLGDTPGALARVLGDFERSGINLTHIDKRPARKSDWAYTFFVDAQGHQGDAAMQLALERARQHCQELTVLGSYPRSRRVL
jgi:chorismate mutase/prephenate dehydratase